jgi:hypothetical protein
VSRRHGKHSESFVTETFDVHVPVITFWLNEQDDGIVASAGSSHRSCTLMSFSMFTAPRSRAMESVAVRTSR